MKLEALSNQCVIIKSCSNVLNDQTVPESTNSKVIKKMPKDEPPEMNSNSQTCRQYLKSCISYRACIQNTKTKTS